MSDDALVFSTGKKIEKNKKNQNKNKTYQQGKGPIKIRMEKKGRGGKTVTVLYDLPMNQEEARSLMKKLQAHMACGATLKNSAIELSGDNREKVEKFLKNL